MALQTVKNKKTAPKNKVTKITYKNGETKVTLDELIAPSYEEIMGEIRKKIGVRPKIDPSLPKGDWTPQALKVLEERYLIKDENLKTTETPEDMLWRVSWEIASADARWGAKRKDVEATAKEYYKLMVSRQFLPNSPTLMNAGTGNGLQYSACFVLPVEDSMEGIFDALKYQALIHKTGGGTGFSFTRLREGGSVVKTSSGVASGPVSFMRIFDAATNEVKQGGKRRGANMGILRVDHPDVLEFIHCKENGGITNFNISVAITDKFIDAYRKDGEYDLISPKTKKPVGKLSARKVFNEIAEVAWKTGDPGLIFIDRINAGTANPIPALGPIESTNPCVIGDTLVSTKEGLIRMKDVVESHFEGGKRYGGNMGLIIDKRVFDGNNPGTVDGRAMKFFDNGVKETIKLATKKGFELTGTLDHKVLTPKGWVKLSDLKIGDEVCIQSGKGSFNTNTKLPLKNFRQSYPDSWSESLGEALGWLIGDGWMRNGDKNCRVGWVFGKNDMANMEYFKDILNSWYGENIKEVKRIRNTYHLSYHGKEFIDFFQELGVKPVRAGEKEVPESIFQATESAVKGFLRGLFTADGTIGIQKGNGTRYIRLSSKSKKLLQGVQLLLLNLGIMSGIYDRGRGERRETFVYKNKNGVIKKYPTDGVLFELQISRDQIPVFLDSVGFLNGRNSEKVSDLRNGIGYHSTNWNDKVVSLMPGGSRRVYDLTEEKSYTYITNGIVSFDCGEQPLYPFDVCNLGSVFLTYFVKDEGGKKDVDWEKLAEVTHQAVRFLDGVIEVNPFPLPQIRKIAFNIRRIGLGVGGWSDLLVNLGIPYDSDEAIALAKKVMKFIQDEAVKESEKLASVRGPFFLFPVSIYRDGTPRRHSTVTTIAPTGTISIIAGSSSGIEPMFAIAYQHIVHDEHLDRKLSFVNPDFEKVARERGFWTEELMTKVSEKGVVRDIAEIPEDVRRVFGTAHEIDIDWHIKTQAAFQKYTENAVSKTVNLRHDATVEDVKRAYLMAWDEGCKGITIFRDGSKGEQVLNLGLNKKEDIKEVEAAASQVILDRPVKVEGATYRIVTPLGSAFITVNQDAAGNPFEVFITIGKAGSEVAAMAEALGRMISTTLRFGNHKPPIERAREIVDQLKGIGGGRSVGFGPNRVRSLPDAVAKAISMHFGFNDANHDSATAVSDSPQTEDTNKVVGDICPSCGSPAMVYEEGCGKCHACGHSEC